jgi:hypothetical protein
VLDVHFVILGAVFGVIGYVGYVRDTLLGRNQPNRVTFLLWAVAPLLAFSVQVSEGVGLRSLVTFMVGFGPLAILAASFINSQAVWRIGLFDYVCGALSCGGLMLWLVTRHGIIALVTFIAADALAALPTIVKSWVYPQSESMVLYLGSLLNALVTLLTVDHFTTVVVAFPIYVVVLASLLLVLVAGRLGPRFQVALEQRGSEHRDVRL